MSGTVLVEKSIQENAAIKQMINIVQIPINLTLMDCICRPKQTNIRKDSNGTMIVK